MDVKKAISLLSIKRDVARKLQESWKGVEYCPPDGVVASAELFSCQCKDYADALDLAISVLELMPEVKDFNFRKVTKLAPMQEVRETFHIDRNEWTAEWIYDDCEFNLPKCSACGCRSKDANYGHKNNFCPKCGRAMTLEAWAELERRLSGENL